MNIKYKIVIGALTLSPFVTGCYNKYIVEDKVDNMVVFKGLNDKDTVLRIMKFEDVADGMEYYKRIEIGDTLLMHKSVSNSVLSKNYTDAHTNIIKINGKRLYDLQAEEKTNIDIMKRDSILNKIAIDRKMKMK